MKTMRFFTTLLMVILCVGLSSCSKDDDEQGTTVSIVGTWSEKPSTEQFNYTFKADGTGVSWTVYNGTKEDEETFTYTFDSKTMKLTIKGADGKSQSGIIEINDKVLRMPDADGGFMTFYKQ